MEQRGSKRKPLALATVLNTPGLGLVSARTRDIGIGGMYVETGRIQIPSSVTVSVSLMLDSQSWQPLQLDATVVRSEDSGAGLMFGSMELHILDTLRLLIYGEGRIDSELPPSLSLH